LHDLIPLGPALPGALTTAEIDATMAYAQAEKSAATRACYASDWRDFAAWCAGKGAVPLPAHVGIVAAYLSHLASAGLKASTIGRRHKLAGHEPPTASEGVRATLRGIRRTIGTATAQKTAITAGQVVEIMKTCPATLIGRRDAALISFGFLSAMRRSELIALTMDDLTEVPDGLRVVILWSKTDGEGRGQEIAIPRGAKIRPVEAVQTWLAAANIATGHVFRPVSKGGYGRGGNDVGGRGAGSQKALRQDRSGPRRLCRPFDAQRLRHGGGGGERTHHEDRRANEASQHGHAQGVQSPRRSLPRPRLSGVRLIAISLIPETKLTLS
jgi:integrase